MLSCGFGGLLEETSLPPNREISRAYNGRKNDCYTQICIHVCQLARELNMHGIVGNAPPPPRYIRQEEACVGMLRGGKIMLIWVL